jgi:nucleoside 2-deoxyribosyltransferase
MNLLNGRTVYLAGPIESSDNPHSWRNELNLDLKQISGLRVWDPLIKPKWCAPISGDDQRHDLEKFRDGPMVKFKKELDRNRDIREICLRLVSACDFIICMLGERTVGTFEELAHAAMMKKPVLFIGVPDSCWRIAQ